MKIINKYARHFPSGALMRCTAKVRANDAHLKEKFIYDSLELAKKCARELRKVGMSGLRPYPCPRSQHGHAHLTRKRVRPS